MVADNERVAISKDLALHQVAIPGEEPTMFCQDSRDERLIGNELFVGGVVSKYPEPASQPTEHRIGEESHGLNDRRIERLHAVFYPAGAADF
jgi:hypothetical protein